MLATIGRVLAPTLHKLNYDPIRDLAPVSLLMTQPAALVVQPSFSAKSLKEVIALAREHPGKLNYGSGGRGTFPYVAMSLLIARTGINVVNINYRGGAPTIVALLRGEIQMTFQTIAGILPQVQSGDLRALAVTSQDRISTMPNVPTVSEAADLAGYDASNWYGILAPGQTPKPIISQLHQDFVGVLKSPDLAKTLAVQGLQTIGSSPAEFDAKVRREIPRWAEVFKSAGR